jgi:hypothetical protein
MRDSGGVLATGAAVKPSIRRRATERGSRWKRFYTFPEPAGKDRAGDYHSDALHLTERYTPTSPNTLLYEVTVDDPKVYTRPWKMSMPLYRRIEKNMQLLEYNCVPYVEELMYGHLRKVRTPGEIEEEDKAQNPGGN